jgi:hypothetical protein
MTFTCNFHVVRNYLYTYTWSCVYLATTECDKAEILLKHRWSHHWRGIFEECCSGSWVGTFTFNSFLYSFLPVDCGCVALEVIVEAWADLWAQEILPKKELCIEAMTAVDYSLDWYPANKLIIQSVLCWLCSESRPFYIAAPADDKIPKVIYCTCCCCVHEYEMHTWVGWSCMHSESFRCS